MMIFYSSTSAMIVALMMMHCGSVDATGLRSNMLAGGNSSGVLLDNTKRFSIPSKGLTSKGINFGHTTLQHSELYDTDIEPLIIEGNEAEQGEYPFYVALGDDYFCGGSLIAPKVVLSAAHCVVGFPTLVGTIVRIGAFVPLQDNAEGMARRTVIEVLSHPDYTGDIEGVGVGQDFVLLLLKTAGPSSAIVAISNDPDYVDVGTPLTVIGLGTIDPDIAVDPETGEPPVGVRPDQLLEVDIEVFPDSTCLDFYGPDFYKPEVTFCAGVDGGGEGACKGDSGGPVLNYNPKDGGGYPIQVGVVSYGPPNMCATGPAGFARIPQNGYDWIKTTVCDTWGESASFCNDDNEVTTKPVEEPAEEPSEEPAGESCDDFLQLILVTDGSGYDTTATLFDYTTGERLWDGYAFDDFTTYSIDACLDPTHCTILSIHDYGGDGFTGEVGDYGIAVIYNDETVFFGGDIGSGRDFTLGCA